MGVYIKGIRISEICSGCDLKLWAKCVPAKRDVPLYADNLYHPRPNWCPATQIPPHGDLIDINELKKKILEPEYMDKDEFWNNVLYQINHAPVVIEADGGKNDY